MERLVDVSDSFIEEFKGEETMVETEKADSYSFLSLTLSLSLCFTFRFCEEKSTTIWRGRKQRNLAAVGALERVMDGTSSIRII